MIKKISKAHLRKILIGTIISLVIVISIAGFLGFLYSDSITEITELIAKKTGFLGLALIILIADSLIPAFPTDIILLIIAKSSLNNEWGIYILIIGITSIIAGVFGWNIGQWIRNKTSFNFMSKHKSNSNLLQKYGALGVAIGALTPIPFSITCWTAGFLKMPFKDFLLASFFRIPRYFIYFIAINYSEQIINIFK
jgi:membrane protein YqaA with SNARE-associated domain